LVTKETNKIRALKLYITAYIKVSILNNEPKTIKLEEVLNSKNIITSKIHKESNRFIELVRLENTNLLTVMLSIQENIFNYSSKSVNLKYKNRHIHIDKIEENVNEIKNIIKEEISKKNLKVKNVRDFTLINKNEDTLHYLMLLNRFLTLTSQGNEVKILKKTEVIKSEETFEEKANYLLKLITNIMGIDNSNGGGLILFKFSEGSKGKTDYTIISSMDKSKVKDDFNNVSAKNLFSTNTFINGYKYMGDKVNGQTFYYDWSSISAYKKDDNNWRLQDGNEFINNNGNVYAEVKVGNKRGIKRFNFIRISTWKNNEIQSNGVIVLFDNKTDTFEQSKIRYVLSVRNKIADFLEKNYNNDTFRSWIEKKKIADIIKSRFDKFKHGAGIHLQTLQDVLKSINPDLYSYSKFVETDIWIGNKFSHYLTSRNITREKVSVQHLKEEFFLELKESLFNASKFIPNTKLTETIKNDFDIITDRSITTELEEQTIIKIVFEIYNNFLYKAHQSSNKEFIIKVKHDKLILKGINGRVVTYEKETIFNHIEGELPLANLGIGLFGIFRLYCATYSGATCAIQTINNSMNNTCLVNQRCLTNHPFKFFFRDNWNAEAFGFLLLGGANVATEGF